MTIHYLQQRCILRFLSFPSPFWHYIHVNIHDIPSILISPSVRSDGLARVCLLYLVLKASVVRLNIILPHDLMGAWFCWGGVRGVEVLALGPSVGMG